MPKDAILARVTVGGRAVELAESLGRIDLDDLRRETEEAGAQALYYGILTAQAHRRANEAKADLDLTAAHVARETRRGAETRGEKLTEAGVTEAVRLDPRYQQAVAAHLATMEAAEIVESAKYVLVQKQRQLEALTGLLVQELQARRSPGGLPAVRQPLPGGGRR